jgi:ubiquinone/menaquinone biosynthesis C-methylase UbiE
MAASPPATDERIKEANEHYHDVAASEYDSKWGIDFGQTGQAQVRGKLRKALAGWPADPFERALEIGAGTGYFSLNLLQAGLISEATATDISPGMLDALRGNARRLGLKVRAERAEAERLPFEDGGFDLVFGHAVLHHIPDLPRAFSEFHRVLRPGGMLAFCGEPSRYGDRLAIGPKYAARAAAPIWRLALGASRRRPHPDHAEDGHELERDVDVHAFGPDELRGLAEEAGFAAVRVGGEELLASVHGWTTRTLEGSAEPDQVPAGWRHFAFRTYLALQRIDAAVLEPRLPATFFYNLLVSARKPAGS